MLDIGFSEIVVISVLALVVLGPEKLPRVASQVGRWIGRARGMARQFREQLEEEVNLEEIRKSQPPINRTPAPPPSPPNSQTSQWQPASPASAAPEAQPPAPAPSAAAQAEPQMTYPDTYSHAHPTDSLGRPIPAPTSEPATGSGPEPDSAQQDWIGGVTVDNAGQTPRPDEKAPQATFGHK
jgi:sec-independent protein translocase protein TatB